MRCGTARGRTAGGGHRAISACRASSSSSSGVSLGGTLTLPAAPHPTGQLTCMRLKYDDASNLATNHNV